ncbi:MAG: Hsp20 family protein [Pseudomonadota bacterium]
MRSLDFAPYYRSSVGFDRMLNALGRAQRTPEAEAALPPYDVESVGEDRYRITMALAGWSAEELSVVAEANALTIEGQRRPASAERKFLHRGIALQPFRCQFELADFVVVLGASLQNGLLTIELERQIPEAMKPRKIDISTSGRGVWAQGRQTREAAQ